MESRFAKKTSIIESFGGKTSKAMPFILYDKDKKSKLKYNNIS
jgi:hypothetical protein